MKVTVCDICKTPIFDKSEFKFKIGEDNYRLAVLQIRSSNGIRWKEADICPKCLRKHITKIVIEKIPRSTLCSDCENNQTKSSRYCRTGILKEKRKRYCKYKKTIG
ncbi:MAG: hypothetical protein PHF86_09835 [Candidatus Nanoarchaeia archaeon]|nr:hypothetical protein [Candidatus Nanoarchaeia archaeon]